MKAKLGLAALIAAAAMLAMPVNSAEAGFHKGWNKRHCMFGWLHCHCKRKGVRTYYRKKSAKRVRKARRMK